MYIVARQVAGDELYSAHNINCAPFVQLLISGLERKVWLHVHDIGLLFEQWDM